MNFPGAGTCDRLISLGGLLSFKFSCNEQPTGGIGGTGRWLGKRGISISRVEGEGRAWERCCRIGAESTGEGQQLYSDIRCLKVSSLNEKVTESAAIRL